MTESQPRNSRIRSWTPFETKLASWPVGQNSARTLLGTVLAMGMLAACAPRSTNLPPLARAGVQAALDGWAQAGLRPPEVGRGGCAFEGVAVRWAPDRATFQRTCGPATAACLLWDASGHFFRPYEYPVAYMRPDFVLEPNSEPVIHELMHALYRCSGMDWWAPDNFKHLDPRVWEAAGGPDSAQGRARRMMAP